MRLKLILLFFVITGGLYGGRLHHVRTSFTLGENDVMLNAGFGRFNLQDGSVNTFPIDVVYGIGSTVDFSFRVPFVSLGGVENSTVLGDMSFDLLLKIKDWDFKTFLFSYFGFTIGTSGLLEGEGITNPATGEKQLYYPFLKGLGSFYIGSGLTFPVGGLTAHINFTYHFENRNQEEMFALNFRNDHMEIRAAIEYYFDVKVKFLGNLDIGIKPFYELGFRFNWSMESEKPQRINNVFGLWLRFGKVIRTSVGVNLPINMDSRKFLDSEVFINLAAVFR